MTVEFIHQHAHMTEPLAPAPGGRVMLSNLAKGRSVITSGLLSLKFVLAGEEHYTIDGRVHRLRPGDIMVLGQAGSRVEIAVPQEPALGLCVNIPVPQARPAVLEEHLEHAPLHMPFVDHALGARLTRAASLLTRRPEIGHRLAPRLVDACRSGLADFLSIAAQRSAELSAATAWRRGEILRRVELARAYLHDHPGRPIRLAELAAVANLSPFHFARSFNAVHGIGPAAYHRNYRLDRAADLLSHGVKSAGEVAIEIGFSDQASFSRAFLRHHGATPGAYRRR